jgi:hypothetical protein
MGAWGLNPWVVLGWIPEINPPIHLQFDVLPPGLAEHW